MQVLLCIAMRTKCIMARTLRSMCMTRCCHKCATLCTTSVPLNLSNREHRPGSE